LTRAERGPAVSVGGEAFQQVEQPPALAGEPIVPGLVDLEQSGFPEFAESLADVGLGGAEALDQHPEWLCRSAEFPDRGEGVPAGEDVDEVPEWFRQRRLRGARRRTGPGCTAHALPDERSRPFIPG
jgi:hypothetical protein